jgi:hypothetical protein
VRLDLLYLVPGQKLPSAIPDHDIAYIGGGEDGDVVSLERRDRLFRAWPRPVLNDPLSVSRLSRDALARTLARVANCCSPACARISRDALTALLQRGAPLGSIAPELDYPVLIRPLQSHAGAALTKADEADDLREYLDWNTAETFYVTRFVDYRGVDGLFRKYRIAFIDGAPFLCHMAVSADWMIHYLNAGMIESATKRREEARAMAGFETGFAARHRAALARVNALIDLDYFTIDCAETPDGRLLVFEADAGAIVHMMDPPDVFPYKPAQMFRVFAAFDAMLRRRATGVAVGDRQPPMQGFGATPVGPESPNAATLAAPAAVMS